MVAIVAPCHPCRPPCRARLDLVEWEAPLELGYARERGPFVVERSAGDINFGLTIVFSAGLDVHDLAWKVAGWLGNA